MKTLREFESADRYVYDFGICSTKNGFAQLDTGQDAHYFGVWANPFKRVIFTYCEGDCITQIADNDEEFCDEIVRIKQWNHSNGHGWKGIDPGFNVELKARLEEMGLAKYLH